MALPDTRELSREAMLAAIELREDYDLELEEPICIYDLCEKIGITVRFVKINMEGMYDREPQPHIYISALRPSVRRVFTCAHELGHHVFGHGSTIDELQRDLFGGHIFNPNEFLADCFAGHLLMPTLGIRRAFALRGCTASSASPLQIYEVSSYFGVGYETLIKHLAYGLREIRHEQAEKLLRSSSPKKIRHSILGCPSSRPLIVAGSHWDKSFLDVELESSLILPTGTISASDVVVPVRDLEHGRLFTATRTGIGKVYRSEGNWRSSVRVSKATFGDNGAYSGFVGLSRYRHLEELEDA